jgi:cytochrome P450
VYTARSELTLHPEAQTRLRAELAEVFGDRPPSVEDVTRLSFYTRALLLKSMRLYPPAWSIGREAAVEPCEVGGYALPAGAQIRISQSGATSWILAKVLS